jgi:hypothetical protein
LYNDIDVEMIFTIKRKMYCFLHKKKKNLFPRQRCYKSFSLIITLNFSLLLQLGYQSLKSVNLKYSFLNFLKF